MKSILTLNFTNILVKFNYLYNKINDEKQHCDINQCIPLVTYIKKTLNKSKKNIKFINKIIKRLELFDNTLQMTILHNKI